MSGHSKWATIKRKKAANDAARGKMFTRLIKEIQIAAREGGGDPENNPRLRLAIQNAKSANMPADNIKKAIMRGTGEMEGVHYDEITYEGYGPGGVAILIEVVTDNRNRTVAEIRHLFSKYNGNLAENGSVAWKFSRKGIIRVPSTYDEEELLLTIIDAGAEDLKTEGESYVISTPVDKLDAVKRALEENGIEILESNLTMVPQNTLKIEGKEAEQVLRLMEAFEDHDDVQNVYADFDIDDTVMEKLQD
ncbi:MAG: YebC/PmpR family DNA-binding transcriptional regulator [Chlorobi bacterium]|nr:YebC/PmpR family DNA-binding transcriptional regulator [Chlorobiota bacterium]